MKILLVLAFAMAAIATTAALESRRVDQHEGNELEDLNGDDYRDKRHLVTSKHNLHSSRLSLSGVGATLGIRQMTHNSLHKRYGGVRRGRPLLGLGSGLSHTSNRKTFGAGIRGPLGGGASIHSSSYNRGLGLIHRE